MHVLLAPDKFKGSLTAVQVADAVTAGLRAAAPGVPVVQVPVADGGDGTLDAAISAGYRRVPVEVGGPLGDPVRTAYAVRDGVAVVELADACGLRRLPEDRLAPLTASSAGLGRVIRVALDDGCHRVVVGVGGSASTDGGVGMLTALGARFLDDRGQPLPMGGSALSQLAGVDLSGLHPALPHTQVVLASDVNNPLLGARGAAAVYGPQKGATPADVASLDAALTHLSTVLARETGHRPTWHGHPAADAPGAGAAGGVGFAAIAVLGAQVHPGIELMLELTGFHERLPGSRLVITGEGSLDEQTLNGKAPAGVAAAAARAAVPVVAVAGRNLLSKEALTAAGFAAAYALTDIEPDPARCISDAGPLLVRLAGELAVDWLSTAAPTSTSSATTTTPDQGAVR